MTHEHALRALADGLLKSGLSAAQIVLFGERAPRLLAQYVAEQEYAEELSHGSLSGKDEPKES